jgi:type I restriction enzyme S subunit
MKDSDIKWLGNIPEHWERLQIKRVVLTKVCDGPHETPLWVEDGVPFVSAEAVKGGKIDFNYKRGYITIEQHTETLKSESNFWRHSFL